MVAPTRRELVEILFELLKDLTIVLDIYTRWLDVVRVDDFPFGRNLMQHLEE